MHGRAFPRARWSRHLCLAALSAAALVVSQAVWGVSVGFTGPMTAAAASGASGHPNPFDPRGVRTSVNHLPPPPKTPGPKPAYTQPRALPVPMRPALVPLDPASGAHFLSSDQVLELSVPAGAVTAADVQAAGGRLSLVVRQVVPASGASAGDWGKYSFGTWLVQVVDAAGRPASRGLRARLGVKLHQDRRAGALDLTRTQVVVNPSLPSWVDLDPAAAHLPQPGGARQTAPATPVGPPVLGPASRQAVTLDAATTTLATAVPMSGANTAFSFNTDAPVATFGKPDPFETDLSAGALSAGIKLDVPAGPGGLTPPLQVAYSSSAVNDQHNPQGAASWVGEGWNLGLGSISWAERNLHTVNPTNPPQWEDSWQLSDAFGTGADLIPPSTTVKTYLDDTSNGITPSPLTWHTSPETRAKVISFSSGIAMPNNGPVAPCFRVFLENGIMEEFGCTANALQFYPEPSGANQNMPYIASWLLDLITDPQGNQIHVTYQRDEVPMQTMTYPRDLVMATVEYDSPACRDPQVMCTGSSWAPLMRVNFVAGHSVSHVSGGSCSANGSLRCDDPVDLAGSGGVPAPLIQSTFVLNDAQVQVRASGSASWSTLRDYQFAYDQAGPLTVTDPVSGTPQSTAGRLLLTRLQVTGADGATSLPPRTFAYTPIVEYYEDSLGAPLPASNCGPSWNNGVTPNGHHTCVLWSQSQQGNSSYLTSVSNGMGLSETFTWTLARNNFHGVVSGSPADPFACDNASLQPTFPCNMPDDGSWSRVVLTQRQDATNGVTSTWNYSYQVPYPLPAQMCSTCVASFYWGSQTDAALLDFYDGKFFGFALTNVSNPDGSLDVHRFYSTEGWGLYDVSQVPCNTGLPSNPPCHNDPWSDLPNAAHGHEYELDQYDTNGTTLLKQVRTQWQAACPPPGVAGSPPNGDGNWLGGLVSELDFDNPEMVCEVHPFQVDDYTYDGTGGPPVHSATSYTYDGLGRVANQVQLANATAADTSGHGSHATLTGEVTQAVAGLVPGNGDTAMSFDGSTGFAELPSGAFGGYPTSGSTTSYTVSFEAWFRTTGGGVILGQTGGSAPPPATPGGWVPALYVDTSGALRESLFWHGGSQNVAAGPYKDGQAHHVVATYTNGVDSLYVDGQLKASQSLAESGYSGVYSYDLGTGYAATWPGTPSGVGWYPFVGTIGEAAVYPTALSAARVQAHFSAGSGYQAAVAADSPAAYWRLNDQAGTTSPNTIVNKPAYVQNDGVTATSTSATGHYLIDHPAFDDVEDTNGNRYQCSFSQYDGMSWTTGQQAALTAGQLSRSTRFAGCGTPAQGYSDLTGPVATGYASDAFGNRVGSSDPDANAGNGAHLGCTASGTTYSSCTTYDGTFASLPTASANALGQTTSTGYQSPAATAPAVVQDGSGHGYNATPGANVTFGAAGLVGGDPDTAMSFDGSVPSTVSLDLPSVDAAAGHQVTVELWMKWNGTSAGMPFGFNRYDLLMNPGSGFGFNTAAGDVYGVPTSAIPANTPVHVVAVFTNGSVTSNQLYINGVAQTLTQRLGTPLSQTATQYASISGWGRDTGNRFVGTLGKVAVYNGALPASRVQAHFGAGAGYNGAVLADSPIAYYRLDETAAQGGFGLWPTSTTDANVRTTGLTYDALGRQTSQTLPVTTIADSSGHGYNGIPNGTMAYGAQGMTYTGDADNAITFGSGGTAGTVNLSIPTVDTAAGHQVTAEFWMTWNGSGTGMPFGFNFYDLRLVPGTGFGFNTANSDLYGVSMSAIPANTPLHIVAVFTNGSETSNQLYINGVAQTLTQLTGTPQSQSATAAAAISSWASDNHYTFPGTLDEVAVYNGALSASRVQAHFNAGVSYRSAVLADSPLAYYRLDEDSRPATQTTSYTVWCTATGAQSPCVEVDTTQRLNATTTATSRAFYDGLGNLVETRSPAAGGQDVIKATVYDVSGRVAFQTVPYLVGAYTGAAGAAAYSTPDLSKGTQSAYDGLGRVLRTTDALGFVTTSTYAVVCGAAGATDAACYEQTLTVDPNGHQSGTLVDGQGRTAYAQRYTGSGTYTLYATARYTYDFVGDLVRIVHPDGVTQSTFGFDMVGRRTSMTDPDLGPQTYSYDADGNMTESVDARAAAGTIFMGYDGLDRPIWRNTTNSPTGAYDAHTYDSTAGGSAGVGRLTGETFAAGSLSGGYAYTYDGRGQRTGSTLTVGGSSYPLGTTYDDAGNVLTQAYPDGETIANSYTAQGWLSGVSTTKSGVTTVLASNLTYSATAGGAFGEITGMHLGGGYDTSATYDLLDRATDLKTTKTSGGVVLFDQSRSFDKAGNVATASTTMPSGTDNQAFCYDEQDRLTWASSATATAPCGGSNTAGTLTAAQYTQSFAYDVLGRLTSGPLGTYTYGDPAHAHAATAIGTSWTAAYDPAGDMTCRATSGGTCAGTQTGAQLGYNNEGELQSWQNAPTSPSTTAQFLYDGQAQRVEQSVTQSGTTTATVYVGDAEEVSTTGGTTTTTTYYYAAGKRIGLSVNGVVSYLASDGLGSATVALNGSGSATASQLFAPYGAVRYSSGTMTTTYGFTGQRSDVASGLDYYGSRYYDPLAGQFTSGDSLLPGGGYDLSGLSRYAYVEGNPENRTDPSGHCFCDVPGTGDNFFPQSGGRLLDGNTGDVYTGPSYTQSYHLASWTARPHHYQPYRPYRAPARRAPARAAAPRAAARRAAPATPAKAVPGLRAPDYINIDFSFSPIPVAGIVLVGGNITYSRSGHIFVGPEAGIGVPGAIGGVRAGQVLTRERPSNAYIDNFISGPSATVSGFFPVVGPDEFDAGVGPNAAVTWGNELQAGLQNFAVEGGAAVAAGHNASLMQSYSFELPLQGPGW